MANNANKAYISVSGEAFVPCTIIEELDEYVPRGDYCMQGVRVRIDSSGREIIKWWDDEDGVIVLSVGGYERLLALKQKRQAEGR